MIENRHQVKALPKSGKTSFKAGQSWSKVTPPPPGLLDPKNFEKTYTVNSLSGNKVNIQMEAVPTSKKAKDSTPKSDPGMGIFAKMFDSENKLDGQLVFDLDSGKIEKYNETLVSTYIAAEESRFQVEGKGPDMLTMGLTSSISLEKVD